jgi:hypothetical protein
MSRHQHRRGTDDRQIAVRIQFLRPGTTRRARRWAFASTWAVPSTVGGHAQPTRDALLARSLTRGEPSRRTTPPTLTLPVTALTEDRYRHA